MRKLLLCLFFTLFAQGVLAQTASFLPGCVYNATPPTLADRQTIVWQCDINGKLITSGGGGGITIGQAVTGGTPSTLIYNDASGLIANSATIPFPVTITPATPGNALTLNNGTITTNRPVFTATSTWNAGGVTFRGIEQVFTITAAAAGSTVERWLGGAAGTTVLASIGSTGIFTVGGNFLFGTDGAFDLGANGASRPNVGYFATSINANGSVINNGGLALGANTGYIQFGGISVIRAPADGQFSLRNAAETGFTALLLGPSGTAYPRLAPTGTGGALKIRKADDSANAPLEVATIDTDGYAVASLPAGATGMRTYVTDQLTVCPAITGTFTGGGVVVCSAFYNGTAWVHE